MSVTNYKMRFIELSYHATILFPMEFETMQVFIVGLHYRIHATMAREIELGTIFHQDVEITRRIEHI